MKGRSIRDELIQATGATERLAFLAEAGSAFASSLSVEAILDELVNVAVPHLADWCTVHLLAEEGVTTQVAGAHADPALTDLIREVHRRYPVHTRTRGGVVEAIRTGRTQHLERVDDETLSRTTEDEQHAGLLRQIGIGTALVVPLVARGRTIGAVSFLRGTAQRSFTTDDRALAEEFCGRAALALDNARLFQTLRAAEHRLRALVHGLDAIIWEASVEHQVFTFVSQQAESMLGYPVGRWLNEPGFWPQLIHPDDRERTVRACREATERGEDHELEYRAITADGRTLWLRQTVDVVVDDDGRPLTIRGLILDVTDRRREEMRRGAEHAVARVLALSTTLHGATPAILEAVCTALGWQCGALWVAEGDGSHLRFVEIWGQAEALEQASRERTFGPGEGLPGRVLETRQPVWLPDVVGSPEFPRAGAAARDGLHAAFAIPVATGERIIGVMEFFNREITRPDEELLATMAVLGSQIGQFIERRRAEVSLAESEARKTAIVTAAMDCVVTIDPDGLVLEWNPAAESTFGFAADEAIGRRLSELIVPAELRDAHETGLRRFRESGRTTIVGQRLELPAMRADGSRFLCELTITEVSLPRGAVFTGYLRDITERKRAEQELGFQKTLLESLSEATTEGILVLRAGGGILYANQRFAELWDVPRSALQSGDENEILSAALANLREPARFLETIQRLNEHPGERFRREIRLLNGRVLDQWSTPLVGPDGLHYGRAWYFRDVSEQKRVESELRTSEGRSRFLSQASALLGSSLDQGTTLERVAGLAVPELGVACAIDLVERDGSLVRVAFACQDDVEKVVHGTLRTPHAPAHARDTGIAYVIRSAQTDVAEGLDAELLSGFAPDEESRTLLGRLGVRCAVSAPMTARGRTLGAITVLITDPRTEEGLVQVVEGLAQRAALAFDNARLYEERTAVAQTLQQSLLPPHLPRVPGAEVAARFHPAGYGTEIGGDFYDIFQRAETSWGIAIGDVCGKGAEAAVLTALARYTVRAAAMETAEPGRILSLLNEAILSQRGSDRFCTVCYADLETTGGRAVVRLAAGGHPLPYVLRHDGRIEKVGRPGTVLGLFPDLELHDDRVELGPGDALILYTDGVTEGRGPSTVFGEGMLLSLLGWCKGLDADAIAERIERTVVEFQKGTPSDDVAVLVVRVPPA